jgi:lipopolysaccharide biosynthesis glycosyltransferase
LISRNNDKQIVESTSLVTLDNFSGTRRYLFVFDHNYIYPFFISLFSLLKNTHHRCELYIASDKAMLSGFYRNEVKLFCNQFDLDLNFLDIRLVEDLPISKGFNTSTYAKLFAVSKIEETFVYFDVDTLFVQNIDDVWDSSVLPNSQQTITARIDPGISKLESNNMAILMSQQRYFNAGVMVIDPISWIKLGYQESFPGVLLNYDNYNLEWLDQCVFNYLLAGNHRELPSKYNHFAHESIGPGQSISIFHFAGSHKKPWRVPKGLIRRFLYLRMQLFADPYIQYLQTEKEMYRFFKIRDFDLSRRILKYRKSEFAKAPHLIDLFLYKFEMKRYGCVVRRIHGLFTVFRNHKSEL